MIVIKEVFDELGEQTQNHICEFLRQQIMNKTHIMRIDLNVVYALRVLACRRSSESEALMVDLFDMTRSHLVRRDIILIMAKWNALYWLSDLKNHYLLLEGWERRAFIVASYVLADEGAHWREFAKRSFGPIEELFRNWAASKANGRSITIPI